jgi:hypothetical protein
MKNLLFLLAFVPTLAFSQVSNWRSNPPQPRTSTPSVQGQRSDVSMWRNDGPREFNRPPQTPRPNYNVIVRPNNLGWGWNNWGWQWNNWGWYQPYPYIWYDDFGWRQRSIVRVYENGKRDTVERKVKYFTAGIGHTNNKQAAFWGAVGGNKGYFIMDYVMTYDIDRNQYYPYGTIDKADFPISKEIFKKEHTLYLGAGKRFGKLGIHSMIGFGNEIQRYQGKDALGGISFPKSNINFTTFKVGLIRDFKWFTLKLDTDPIRGYSQLSVGLNNK